MNQLLLRAGIIFASMFLSGCSDTSVPPVEIQPTPSVTTPQVTPQVTPEVTTPDNSVTAPTPSEMLTGEQAKAIALDHAGLSDSAVHFVKVEFDYERGIPVYEVEFYVENTEYDYEINANTGEIISIDQEIEGFRPSTDSTTGEYLPEEQIKEFALNHANVRAEDAQFAKIKFDFEKGIAVYEVEFYTSNMEYDYEINATTGEILSFDQEMESNRLPDSSTNGGTLISEAEAKAIALNHVNLTEEDVSFLNVKLDYDDGIQEYEVEFQVGRVEYEFEIHGTTGAILSFEKDD